jgi:hypothetical protein
MIWDLEKVDKKVGMETPVLLRPMKVQTGNQPHPVSPFSVVLSNLSSMVKGLVLSDALSYFAIGRLADGTILLCNYLH